jgi:transketolase
MLGKKKEVKKVAKKEVKEDSAAKIAYQAMLDAYKESNPEKYEVKKAALEAKLNTL